MIIMRTDKIILEDILLPEKLSKYRSSNWNDFRRCAKKEISGLQQVLVASSGRLKINIAISTILFQKRSSQNILL